MLAESPVASERNEPLAVDVELQPGIYILVVHLADARLEAESVRNLSVDGDGESGFIKVRRAVAVRPPQLQLSVFELSELFGQEIDLLLAVRQEFDFFFEADLPDKSA